MRKLAYLHFIAGITVAVVGCSSSTTPKDGGAGDMAGMIVTGGDDMTQAPMVNTGTKITGGNYQLMGITSDDQVIALDAKKLAGLSAIPAAGGAPAAITAMSDTVEVRGKLVFAWSGVDPNTGIGTLDAVWSAAGGAKTLGAGGVFGAVGSADDDSAIVYITTDDGTTGVLNYAKADLTGVKKLLSNIDLGDMMCPPFVTSGGKKALFTGCLLASASADAGAPTPDGGAAAAGATAFSVDLTTGALTMMRGGLFGGFAALDRQGKNAFLVDASLNLFLQPLGGSAVMIDASPIDSFLLAVDGSKIFYTTSGMTAAARQLKVATVASPTPTVLVSQNARLVQALSPDNKYIAYSATVDTMTALNDLLLASATTPGTGTPLATMANATFYGDAFTADNSRVNFVTEVDTKDFVGTYKSAAVSGGAPTTHAKRMWVGYATSGTKVIYNDSYGAPTNKKLSASLGHADLQSLDTANGAPTMIATQALPDFFLTKAKDKVIYSYMAVAASAGVYSAPAN